MVRKKVEILNLRTSAILNQANSTMETKKWMRMMLEDTYAMML